MGRPMAASQNFTATFSAELAAKDVGLALAAGEQAGVHLPAARMVFEQMQELMDQAWATATARSWPSRLPRRCTTAGRGAQRAGSCGWNRSVTRGCARAKPLSMLAPNEESMGFSGSSEAPRAAAANSAGSSTGSITASRRGE